MGASVLTCLTFLINSVHLPFLTDSWSSAYGEEAQHQAAGLTGVQQWAMCKCGQHPPKLWQLLFPPGSGLGSCSLCWGGGAARLCLTAVLSGSMQVQSFLLHFWQGMPPHMLPVLGSSTVVNIVGVCDSILYKAISGVLMPTVLQALPDR